MSTGLLTPDQAAQRLDTTLEDLGRRRREGRAPAYYAITRKTIRYDPGDLQPTGSCVVVDVGETE